MWGIEINKFNSSIKYISGSHHYLCGTALHTVENHAIIILITELSRIVTFVHIST